MKVLKYLFELIFIFLLPICFIFISFKYKTINQYDSSGNLISTEKVFDYSDNSILRDYNDNMQYKNYLNFNQLMYYSNPNVLSVNSNLSPNVVIQNNSFLISGNSNTSRFEPLYLNRSSLNLNNSIGHKFYIKVFISNNSDNITVNFNSPNSNLTEIITVGNMQYPVVLSYLYFDNLPGSDFSLNLNFNLIDLTLMFGEGFEPSSVSALSNYFDTSISYNFISSQEIIYYSNDIISSNYEINYTWYSKFFNNFFNELQFNHNSFAKLIIIYLVMTIVFFFFWNIIYWPLFLLFRLLLWKRSYY